MEKISTFRHDRLRSLVLDRNISQSDLAREAGMHQSQLSFYLNAERVPSVESVARLARSLDVTSDYLLGLSDDPRPPSIDLDPEETALVKAYRSRNFQGAMEIFVKQR